MTVAFLKRTFRFPTENYIQFNKNHWILGLKMCHDGLMAMVPYRFPQEVLRFTVYSISGPILNIYVK